MCTSLSKLNYKELPTKIKVSKIEKGDFMDGILIINKPAGMTSHDVINKLRRKYNQKKFGHSGTLDPEATGVLVVLCGKACKVLQFLSDTDKKYVASIQLGFSTTTDDIFGDKICEKPINRDFDFSSVLKEFEGKITQRVPMASAKKIGGKKLMDYQRKKINIEPVYQDVEIYSMESIDSKDLSFEVHCSSGTYVRSICRDFAHRTNNEGCMKSLCRTAVGRFTIENAQSIEEPPILYPISSVLEHLPFVEYENIDEVYHGKRISLNMTAPLICITENHQPIAIYELEGKNQYKSKRGLW